MTQMGFLSGLFGLGNGGAALSGLAGLAALGRVVEKYQPSKDARKTAAAFVQGRKRDGACKVPRSKGCNYQSTGQALKVKGATIAERVGGNNTDTIKICVNPNEPEQKKAGNALLRMLKAGVSIKGSDISGRKGRHRAGWPGCVNVTVSKKVREAAARELNASSLLTVQAGERSAAAKKGATTKRARRRGKK